MNPREIAQEILGKVEKVEESAYQALTSRNLEETRLYNRASALGWARDCPRKLCLNRLCPDKEVFTADQQRRFKEGRLQESMLKAELRAAGLCLTAVKPLLEKNYLIRERLTIS